MKGHFLILFIAGASSFSALAHHSDAIYDRESIVAGEGVVTQYVFRNPHVLIGVEIEDEAGEVAEWLVETGSTPIMRRSGWSEDLISVGDTIIVRLHPEKSGRLHGILNTMELETGEMFHQVEDPPEETVAAESLTGVWRGVGPSVFGQMSNIVPTSAGEAARAAYTGPDPSTECDPLPAPYSIGSGTYLAGIELLEDRAMLLSEFLDSHRTVWMDGRDHPEDGEYTIQGHSIGRWEGETLVVDTRYFEEHERGIARNGVPSSREKHVILRYTLSDDRRSTIVEFVVEDPVYLAEPWQGQMELVYTPHLQLYDYNCIPGTLG
ncbi:MAG: DUF6152 family protein [Gammaproteobacteria bacterium]